ncbi:MAG: aminodeoxychorismate/anthranilate synthase component II [Deltaproteobacteria bacterium]|nr:aminodeoxychorismate/anthranilate synthase component II [Deltaproteobacteria bacterium]
MKVLVIDNYDSFTYNLVQLLGRLGAEIRVARNDAITVEDVAADPPDRLLISPGPGTPLDAGISNALIECRVDIPTLGVCLGHQCIGHVFGAAVVHGPELVHGKTTTVEHDGAGVYWGLSDPFEAARYHSLVVDEATLPEALVVTARTRDGVVMGLRHKSRPLEGVQFHPESFMTHVGGILLRNFLDGRVGGVS